MARFKRAYPGRPYIRQGPGPQFKLGSLPPARKVQTFPPKVTRARIGPRGATGAGIAAAEVFVAAAVTLEQRPPYQRTRLPIRARVGNSMQAGDGTATQNYPPPSLPPTPAVFTRGISMWR